MQDAFNLTSFSFYASLGFEMKESTALMQAEKTSLSDQKVRIASPLDLPQIDALTQRFYKTSRQNAISYAMTLGTTDSFFPADQIHFSL
jgi:hypothetical protein